MNCPSRNATSDAGGAFPLNNVESAVNGSAFGRANSVRDA